jgi:hypothetical protein
MEHAGACQLVRRQGRGRRGGDRARDTPLVEEPHEVQQPRLERDTAGVERLAIASQR